MKLTFTALAVETELSMNKVDIYLWSVNKIGKVFRMKAQTCLSVASFCGLGKRERFLVEEIQSTLSSKC
jgi:hypothetical protein